MPFFLNFAAIIVLLLLVYFLVKLAISSRARSKPYSSALLGLCAIVVAAFGIWWATDALAGSKVPSKDLTREASQSSIEQASSEYIGATREYISIDSKSADAIRKNMEENQAAKDRFNQLPSVSPPAAVGDGEVELESPPSDQN